MLKLKIPTLDSLKLSSHSNNQDLLSIKKKAILRADLNIVYDFETQQIIDDTRIQKVLPTIEYLLSNNIQIILISHFGRPKSKDDTKFTTQIIVNVLTRYLTQYKINFIPHKNLSNIKEAINNNTEDHILMLENIRFFEEETSTDDKTQKDFAKSLAECANFYVNDAFGTCHREHASITGLPCFLPSVAGLLLETELNFLHNFLYTSTKPITFVVGGSKVSTKIKLIEKLMPKVDNILVGGAMAYTFLKSKAIEVGHSMIEKEYLSHCLRLIADQEYHRTQLALPIDHIASQSISNAKLKKYFKHSIPDGYMGVDIGHKTISLYKNIIKKSNSIFWNGPMGVFEVKAFSLGSFKIAKAIAKNLALSIVGGGESVTIVNQLGLATQFNHISTGGGASLQFLEGSKMPGLEALYKHV